MGITKSGRLAVLTNYREHIDPADANSVYGVKSRGEIVNAWLGAPEDEELDQFVTRTLEGKLLKGVGGFSLICGDLNARPKPIGKESTETNGHGKAIEPLIVISNRTEAISGVPRIAGERDGVWGLSNTIYEEPPTWPKIILGRKLVKEAVERAVSEDASEEQLLNMLFGVLDTNTMPVRGAGLEHEKYVDQLKNSIFCPAISDEEKDRDMAAAIARGQMKPAFDEIEDESRETAEETDSAESTKIFEKGSYGTQRQTVILVDWEGRVTYKERALWDAHGNPIERGHGDVVIKYNIEGWR